MMFSSEDIRKALKDKSLIVEPFFEESVRPGGLVLRLGETLLRPIQGKVVDVKNKIVPDFEEIKISFEKPFCLEPGDFVLGHTFEKVTVADSLGFFIEGRSTLARVGLTIVQTAMMVYPGHRDRAITLEIANNGKNPILLYFKMKISRAAIFELKTPTTEPYDENGKYRKQGAVGIPIFEKEFFSEK